MFNAFQSLQSERGVPCPQPSSCPVPAGAPGASRYRCPCWDVLLNGEARLRAREGLALPSVENVAILKRKKGGKCANTHRPVWGTSPGFVQSKFFAPVREPPPTGATALEVHKMNRHSRKNGGKPSCQHVPEEVSHGVSSFREAAPQRQPIREY